MSNSWIMFNYFDRNLSLSPTEWCLYGGKIISHHVVKFVEKMATHKNLIACSAVSLSLTDLKAPVRFWVDVATQWTLWKCSSSKLHSAWKLKGSVTQFWKYVSTSNARDGIECGKEITFEIFYYLILTFTLIQCDQIIWLTFGYLHEWKFTQ